MRLQLLLSLLLTAAASNSSAWDAAPLARPTEFGTTFPYVHMRWAGHDWRDAMDRSRELGLTVLRIGAYWNEIEKQEGRYDFAELDEVLDRAEANGYRVVLTVGMKAPVWPEWYLPDWAKPANASKNAEISRDPKLRARTLRFVRRTVKHLAGRSSIVAWQVENEPLDRAGETRWFIGADFLAEEAAAIREEDPAGRRLIVNLWADDHLASSFPWTDGDYALRNAVSIGDVLGVDVYPKVASNSVSKDRADYYPRQYRRRAAAAGKPAWIIESQAEDWAPAKVGPGDIRSLVRQQQAQGYDTIFLWGFQSWYEGLRAGRGELWNTIAGIARGGS